MSRSMTERIESIIARRKPLAENIQSIRDSIAKISSAYERMTPVCNAVINDESIAREFPGLSEILTACEKPVNELQRLRADLALIQNRFSRDTLNIAVIGRARQGKSRLLQTITGLTSEEIPDGNKEFCTGVRSDIINDSNLTSAFAQVNFLTEDSSLMRELRLTSTTCRSTNPIYIRRQASTISPR